MSHPHTSFNRKIGFVRCQIVFNQSATMDTVFAHYMSADQGSVYGSHQYNTCFVNALVGALSLHGKVLETESIDVLLVSMRTTNGEFISPFDESDADGSIIPKLHPILAQLLVAHDVGIAFFTNGRKYVAFDADGSRGMTP